MADSSHTELQFFGAMTATATHDLKNVIAIINENAGLLEDLTLMAQKSGNALSPDRVATVAKRIRDQVKRGDEMIKTLNRFAHRVDTPQDQALACDLAEAVDKTLELAGRKIAQSGLVVTRTPAQSPQSVLAHPFRLDQAIWQIIQAAMAELASGAELIFSTEENTLWCTAEDPGWARVMNRAEELTTPFAPDGATLHLKQNRLGLVWPTA